MSKPTSSFETFFADAFPENGEGKADAVGLRPPVAQRLTFDCLTPCDGLTAEAEPVKSRWPDQVELLGMNESV